MPREEVGADLRHPRRYPGLPESKEGAICLDTATFEFLSDAFGLAPRDVVALIGAGGKTTTMYRLARELASRGLQAICTTTTRIRPPTRDDCDELILASTLDELGRRLDQAFRRAGRVVLASGRTEDGKLLGLEPCAISQIAVQADIVLVEADGARGKSFKAPAPNEPVVPPRTSLCVLVMGCDIIGKPLNEESVHRVDRVVALSGTNEDDPITWNSINNALLHPDGYLGRVGSGIPVVLFVNKVTPGDFEAVLVAVRTRNWGRIRDVVLGEALSRGQSFTRWSPG